MTHCFSQIPNRISPQRDVCSTKPAEAAHFFQRAPMGTHPLREQCQRTRWIGGWPSARPSSWTGSARCRLVAAFSPVGIAPTAGLLHSWHGATIPTILLTPSSSPCLALKPTWCRLYLKVGRYLTNCPSRLSMYLSLALCVDHLVDGGDPIYAAVFYSNHFWNKEIWTTTN